jgi:hypothetical protein
MTWPDDGVMWSLDAMDRAAELVAECETGRMVLVMPFGDVRELGGAELDTLQANGWVAVDPETQVIDLTAQGDWALRTWHERRERQGRRKHRTPRNPRARALA